MIERGLSPATVAVLDLPTPASNRPDSDIATVTNKEPSQQAAAAVAASSSTPSAIRKRPGNSAFAEHADPVEALVVDDDP